MTQYTQNTPIYFAIQWNGSNQQQLVDLVLTWISWVDSVSVDSNGALIIDHAAGLYTIPPNGYMASGPRWGGLPEVTPLEILTEEAFTARFSSV